MIVELPMEINGIAVRARFDSSHLQKLIPKTELTQKELADRWNCSQKTVRNRGVRKNKNGKYSMEEIEKFER